jgi:hypothetical protein
MRRRRVFTEAEDDYIRTHWADHSIGWIAERLDRCAASVYLHGIESLKLPPKVMARNNKRITPSMKQAGAEFQAIAIKTSPSHPASQKKSFIRPLSTAQLMAGSASCRPRMHFAEA